MESRGMGLNKPGNGKVNPSLVCPQDSHLVPESPGAKIHPSITLTQTADPPSSLRVYAYSPKPIYIEANIEVIAQAIAQANTTQPPPLTSPQTFTQPSSAPSHTNTTHTHTYTHTSRFAYYRRWCAAFVAGHHPPKRPPHTHTPTHIYRACRWLWRRVSLMGLCVCVCVGGMGALVGVAMAIEDNYSCVGGEHTAQRGDTVWSVVASRCSGNRQHAYDDVVAAHPHIEAWGMAQGEVIVIPHSGG